MKVRRKWAMPNSNTFKIKPIKELIGEYYNEDDRWLNPFANISTYGITNDLNPKYNTDYNLDALEFIKQFDDNSIDGVLFDPPFSPRQVSECYKKLDMTVNMKTTQSSFWGNLKKEIARVVKKDGIVITFGWNSGGCAKSNGFEIQEVLIVPHGGWHNDTICTVDKMVK